MLIRSRRASDVAPSEITSEALWLRRRELLRGSAVLAGSIAFPGCGAADSTAAQAAASERSLGALEATRNPAFQAEDSPTSYEDATSYNNYYEFGTDKTDPARYAHALRVEPWSVRVDGACAKRGDFALEDVIGVGPYEERLYRHRCVEAWSMVIPWVGLPLGSVLSRFEPLPNARFVELRTVVRPEEMRGVRARVLDFPYVEGLRMDEAMHSLAFLAIGIYGRELPNQNGAPLRLVTPWKYGFKGVKSIVSITFREDQPATTWNLAAPNEYGFYANVNPDVSHPRWSQSRERRIGELRKRPTLPFNGYAEEVGSLYAGMDLGRWF